MNQVSNELIAEVCHEANRGLCESQGDMSQPVWAEAPEWQRKSALDGVRCALEGASPEESHENWLKGKHADGWVYGSEKDPELKTHPCMVPYGELPESQRAKDHVFTAIVRALGRTVVTA